ncbi:MAG: Cyclopropane-fatty-acyl-phospholipid synthase, partial [uncultured Acetobacteraceae bacterium]
ATPIESARQLRPERQPAPDRRGRARARLRGRAPRPVRGGPPARPPAPSRPVRQPGTPRRRSLHGRDAHLRGRLGRGRSDAVVFAEPDGPPRARLAAPGAAELARPPALAPSEPHGRRRRQRPAPLRPLDRSLPPLPRRRAELLLRRLRGPGTGHAGGRAAAQARPRDGQAAPPARHDGGRDRFGLGFLRHPHRQDHRRARGGDQRLAGADPDLAREGRGGRRVGPRGVPRAGLPRPRRPLRPGGFGRHDGARGRRQFRRLFPDDPRAPRGGRVRFRPLHRAQGAAGQHEPLHPQAHLPRRLRPRPVGGLRLDRAHRALGGRHGGSAAPLRAHPAALAGAFRRQPGARGGALRRAVLPHVGILPGGRGGRLSQRLPDGVPTAALDPGGRRADPARLHGGRGARRIGCRRRPRRGPEPPGRGGGV